MNGLLRISITLGAVAAAALLAVAGCDDGGGGAPVDAGNDGGTDTDTDADTDAGPDGGDATCDRGDPAQFPTDCLASCEDACARLDECGGADANGCPLTLEDCTAMCPLALGGPYWGDISEHFLCCTAQEDCAAVQGCGGWLAHPDTVEPCDLMCECFGSMMDMGSMRSAHTPPPGYAWAPSVAAIRPGAETADYENRYGVEVVDRSGLVFLRVTVDALREMTAYRLAKHETPLPTFVDAAGRLAAADGDIVIRATDPAAIAAAEAIVASTGFAAVRELPWSKGRLRIAEGGDPWVALDVLGQLNAIPGVRAELDMVRIYEKLYTPDDPMFADQWHLLNGGQDDPTITDGPQLAVSGVDSRVSEAWDTTLGVPETVIAILDDGVNVLHPDLAPNALEPYNYPEDWAENHLAAPYSGGIGSHGTECAGVAAARGDNGMGVSGVCPTCSLQPALIWDQTIDPENPESTLPVGGSFQMTDAACAGFFTDLVDLGAGIISNSWGPSGEDPVVEGSIPANPDLSTVMSEAFEYAETDGRGGLGTIILFAAGNSNFDVSEDTYVDVAAPSNGGLLGITTVATSEAADTDPQYDYQFGGTSSATPFVAGVLGLILSADPALTAAEARQILTDSATPVDPVWGQWADGFSPYYGYGVVNAWRAVQMATGACSDPAACDAPSDVCASGCDGTACALCRTDNDCADGWACQALPALGASVCVEAVASDTCGTDYTYVNGYCLPNRNACGLCDDAELCNGRDDDCDGTVDEELTGCAEGPPDHSTRCLQDGAGCPSGESCAATSCRTTCTDSSECGDGEECLHPKTRYGDIDTTTSICYTTGMPVEDCSVGCQVMASSLVDEELAAYRECILALESCDMMSLFACAQLLPINF